MYCGNKVKQNIWSWIWALYMDQVALLRGEEFTIIMHHPHQIKPPTIPCYWKTNVLLLYTTATQTGRSVGITTTKFACLAECTRQKKDGKRGPCLF